MTLTLTSGTILAATGLCLGSYVSTAALRWSRQRQSSFGRSSCDHCGIQLGFARTVPVLSYASQRGVCSNCGGSIDGIHLIGEMTGAAILVVAFAATSPARALLLSFLGLVLLAEALCDAKTQRLPDPLTVAIVVLGTALAAFQSRDAILWGALSAGMTFVCLEGVRRLYLKWRGRPGLGFGDVKLLTAVALWTGVQTPWVLVLAALLGLGVAAIRPPAHGRLAFGPCIAVAAWIVGMTIEAGLWPTWA